MSDDPFNLRRFLQAQEPIIEQVRAELSAGCKASHWMWFVFPQITGLGRSPMAQRYAIRSREEALAYLTEPLLGERLRELTALVNRLEDLTVYEIFGAPDDMKFQSSMTLFAEVAPEPAVFEEALARYFGGARDAVTQRLLSA